MNGWNFNSVWTISLRPCQRVWNDFEATGSKLHFHIWISTANTNSWATRVIALAVQLAMCGSANTRNTATGQLPSCSPNQYDYGTSLFLAFPCFLWLPWGFVHLRCYVENEQHEKAAKIHESYVDSWSPHWGFILIAHYFNTKESLMCATFMNDHFHF